MKRRILVIAVVAGAVCAAWALFSRGDGPARRVLRGPPPVPAPSEDEKTEFFYRRMVSGDQSKHPGSPQANWRLFGEAPLKARGQRALDFLLAEGRLEEYRALPNVLANVLRFLPEIEGFRSHPRLYPFLRHWLDPENCPPRRGGENWPADIRRQVFQLLVQAPDASFAPLCVDELRREERLHDLRNEAILVLLHGGRGDVLLDLYPSLPPDEDEPERLLRHFVLNQLDALAAGGRRREVEALRPILQRSLASDFPGESAKAAGILLRLGDAEMADRLLAEFDRQLAAGHEAAAWDAMLLLVNQKSDPRAKARCLEQFRGEYRQFVGSLLARGWAEDPDVRERLWAYLEEPGNFDVAPLGSLLRADRERTVAYLIRAIEGAEQSHRTEAIRLASTRHVTEIGPALLDLAREERDEGRLAFYYGTLSRLGVRGAVPLLRHELGRPGGGTDWRKTVATLLLQYGDEALAPLADALREGDRAVLEAFVPTAAAAGADAVPDRLVPAFLDALERMPGEGSRRDALFVLRCRGVLDPVVREGLIEAYRREPSSRVADEIAAVLVELAHR